MTHHPQSITSIPRSADDDRHRRMVRYSVTMGIRIVCVILLVFVRDWWLLVVAAGAVFLPWVAVILANAVDSRYSKVERPGARELATLRSDEKSSPDDQR